MLKQSLLLVPARRDLYQAKLVFYLFLASLGMFFSGQSDYVSCDSRAGLSTDSRRGSQLDRDDGAGNLRTLESPGHFLGQHGRADPGGHFSAAGLLDGAS